MYEWKLGIELLSVLIGSRQRTENVQPEIYLQQTAYFFSYFLGHKFNMFNAVSEYRGTRI